MKLKMSKEVDLGKEPIGHLLFVLAVPSIISQVVNALYNMVDRMYIGHIPGEGAAALTGLGVCFPVIMIVSAFAALMGMGGAPRASILMGKKDNEGAEKILGNCFSALVITAVVLTALVLVFKRPLLMMFGASENTIGYAESYLNIYAVGTIFVQLTLGLNAFIAAQGFSKISMMTVVIGAVTNIVLDPIFISVLGFGAAGAAIATVIGNICSDIFFVWFLLTRSKRLSVSPSGFYIHKAELLQIFAIGIPASITNLMQSLGIALTNRSLLPFGNDHVAAMGIVMKVNMIAVLILVGFAFGGQPLIGYNYGAKNRRRLKEILSFAYKFECGLALLLTILLSLAARPMIRIFMKDNTIVSLGVPMLRMQLLGMVFVAIVLVTTCTFQSAGMARNAFLLSISRQGVIFAIVLAIASHTIGYQGILLSQAISDLLTAVLAIALYRTSVAKELHT